MKYHAWGAAIAVTAIVLASRGADEAPGQSIPEPVFLQSFQRGGDAWLRGGLAYRFALDDGSVTAIPGGAGYRFEPPYTNLLRASHADPSPGSFVSGDSAVLSSGDGYGASSGLLARGRGLLWETLPVEVTGLISPHRDTISLAGSVYLRSATPGARVRLSVRDEVDATPWRELILAANEAALKKKAEAKVTPPLETVSRPGELTVGTEWQRLTASLTFDGRRPVQRLVLALETVPGAEGEAEAVEVVASALQVEQIQRYPDNKDFAGPWVPGGQRGGGEALTVPLQPLGLNPRAGTLACRVRLPPPDGGGHAGGTLMVAGGGWWQPIWALGTSRCYAGDAGRDGYKAGQSLIEVPVTSQRRLRDGAWHRLVLTWAGEALTLYLDGEPIASAVYLPIEPAANAPFRLGGSTLDGGVASAEMTEAGVWDRALTPAEIAALDGAGPLAERLPPAWMARPERVVFHRGEASATLPVAIRLPPGMAMPERARLSLPALGVDEEIELAAEGRAVEVPILPWRASPGRYPFRLSSADGALAVEAYVEIVAALPPTDFYMLGWTSTPEVGAYGFTAELVGAGGLETVLRRGRLASLRYDARKWHPLDPETLTASLDAARRTARQAAAYPHVVACLMNTEVGIGAPPAEPWFAAWMQQATRLDGIPAEVALNPLRIGGPAEPPPIVPPDDPAWRYARWMNGEGKGWPELNARAAAVMREEGLGQVLFYTDQPQTIADLRGLDMVDYWEYPHTSAGLVAQFNRVCNLARLAGKRVSLMPGTIYHDPWPFQIEGKTVCLSPDTMRQFLWIAVANPLDHLGLYGFGELEKGFVPPGLREALAETAGQVYPVGLLTGGLRAPAVPVAYLHTSGQWWQGPGDNQWIEWWFNRMATRALAEARLPFDWIGDEQVEAGRLDRYAAVVVLGAWRVPQGVHEALAAHAAAGGDVVVDSRYRTPPPGATVLELGASRHPRSASPESAAALQRWARDFRARHPAACRLRDGDEAWLFEKTDGEARFVFAVNDRAEPGLLGGEHGLSANLGHATGPLRDRGLAQTVVLTVPAAGAVYDLRGHRRLESPGQGIELELGPGDAAVLALAPIAVGGPRLAVPEVVEAGTAAVLRVEVSDERGQPLGHRTLVELTAVDAAGRPVELPRYQRVERGRVEMPLRMPLDATPGELRIEVLEWLAGGRAEGRIRVLAPAATGARTGPRD